MTLAVQLLLAFTGMVLLSLAVGASTRRTSASLRTFFWGDNDLTPTQGGHLLLSTGFAMNGIMYFVWLGYTIGLSALLLQVIWCLSYILFALKGDTLTDLSRSGTLHGIIGGIFGAGASRAAAIASVLGFVLMLGWELIIGVSIFAAVNPADDRLTTILILSLAGIGAVYSMLGGLRGNMRANEIQNIVGAASLVLALGYLMTFHSAQSVGAGGFPWRSIAPSALVMTLGVGGLITNAVFSVVYQFVDMSAWQNIAATTARNRGPSKALVWASVAIFLFPGVFGTLIGIYMRAIPGLTSDNIVPTLLQLLSANPILTIAVTAGFVGAMLSTIDGLLLAAAQATLWDLTHRASVRHVFELATAQRTADNARQEAVDTRSNLAVAVLAESDDEPSELEQLELRLLRVTRYLIVATALVGAYVTLWITRTFGITIFDLIYLAFVGQLVLCPVVFSALFLRPRRRRFGLASIVCGLVAGVSFAAYAMWSHDLGLLPWAPTVALGVATVAWLPSLFPSRTGG